MSDLRAFVLDLSRDPQKVEELKADPDGVMDTAGLSEEHKELVRSGDVERIRAAVTPEGRDGEGGGVVVVVVVI